MKRHGGLWPQVIDFENLLQAWRKARMGKTGRDPVLAFALELEPNLLALGRELSDGSYRPGAYRQFTIYDRKPRIISAAPFRDRVVHHALMNIVDPLLDRRLIHDCYACRKGKGVHAAVARYQGWARRYPYVLKVDVQQYFPSIDHDRIKEKLRRQLKDRRVLGLFDLLIDSAPESHASPRPFAGDDLVTLMQRRRGLPIGNLTSQFLGNLYLSDLDHYIKQHWGVRPYLRYVDDLMLLDHDKGRLWELRWAIDEFLARERLRLHPNKAHLLPVRQGVDVLGYRVFPDHRRMRRDAGYRYRRRLRTLARHYAQGRIGLEPIRASVAAWLGHSRHADSDGLVRAVLASVSFSRGAGRESDPARGSRRRLEQQTDKGAFRQPQQE